MKNMKIRLEFKPQDFWIGVFWKRYRLFKELLSNEKVTYLDIWICLIPCFSIHLQFTKDIKSNNFTKDEENVSENDETHLSDIILNGCFTMGFISLIYFILERIGLVPIISLRTPYQILLIEKTLTNGESFIFGLISVEISWILANLIYWKLIRKKKIIF